MMILVENLRKRKEVGKISIMYKLIMKMIKLITRVLKTPRKMDLTISRRKTLKKIKSFRKLKSLKLRK